MAVHAKDVHAEMVACETGVKRFNRRLGSKITNAVATMACAYVFGLIALVSLPQALHDSFSGGFKPLPIITWLAQTFLQLVLLAVILYGQNLMNEKADARAEATFRNTTEAEVDMLKALAHLDAQDKVMAEQVQQNNDILQALDH